jgi:ATP-dependent exoDNAse (exonuclease V) alpha subunit
MACYHFSSKIINRSNGSACAAAAYRSAEKITNEFDGITHDYSQKTFVDDAVIMLPENAPAEFADRQTLWNAVEQTEKQAKAQLAREIEFSLPVELPPEVRKHLALEFVQEQFVDKGMIADVCFHKQHQKNNVKKGISANPHCHVLLTLRPIDESGRWESKNTTLYLCEKNGKQKMMSSQEIKEDPSWEKIYQYIDESGSVSWHTKSYVVEHEEEGLKQVNKYPKRENVQNPKIVEWNSRESLISWRRAWADKQNLYLETYGIDARVDHRSYKDQGLNLIPTVHEGKAITAMERKLKAEYDRKIANGEDAVLQHTDIRNMNIAIQEHNTEIRIIAEMKRLRKQMVQIIKPVKVRIAEIENGIAEKLELLRAELISLGLKIKKVVSLKGEADEKIKANQAYIKDLQPVRKSRLEALRKQRNSLQKQYESLGFFSAKKRDELLDQIESIDDEISLLSENCKYAVAAKKEIVRLKNISDTAGKELETIKANYSNKKDEYIQTERQIPADQLDVINEERMTMRPSIEMNYIINNNPDEFKRESISLDKDLGYYIKGQTSPEVLHLTPKI